MPVKSFASGKHSFVFERDKADPNPASELTFYDEEEVRNRFWYPNIKEGDVIFDIGAGFGSYMLPALAMGALFVLAFSPEHDYDQLIKNLELNGWHCNNKKRLRCIVNKLGLYSQDGFVDTLSQKFDKVRWSDEPTVIRVTTLDKLVADLRADFNSNCHDCTDRIDFIKLDVEGAELEVLKGGLATIRRYRPKLLIENHIFKNQHIDEQISEWLEYQNLGYHKIGPISYGTVTHSYYER